MRWIVRGLIALAGLIVLVLVVIYAGSEWKLRRGYDVAATHLAIPTDTASIAEGARLARIAGCRDCHGQNGQGTILEDSFLIGRLAPPALTRVATRYTDAELERAIRHGVRRDGSTLYIMPTSALRFLSDDDTARIIAWIRSLRASPAAAEVTMRYGPLGRALILFGMVQPSAFPGTVSAKTRPAEIGRYYVDVSCAACHALHTERPSDDGEQIVPALAPMAASYDLADFTRLLRTGQGKSRRDLGMMRSAALGGLRDLTDPEIAAVHEYLKTEAEKAPAR
jgi:cytochrome c553